jgi:hypothetical protein
MPAPLPAWELPHTIRKLGESGASMADRAYDNLKSAEIKLKFS